MTADVAGERLPIWAASAAYTYVIQAILAWWAIRISLTLYILLAGAGGEALESCWALFVGSASRLLANSLNAKLGPRALVVG